MTRPVALVTGASRRRGIPAAVAVRLARSGWNVATTHWRPYDAEMPWGADSEALTWLRRQLGSLGAATVQVEHDLAVVEASPAIFDAAEELGPVRALVLAHCVSVNGTLLDTTIDNWDRHMAVNARGSWLLIREFASRYREPPGLGRIVGLTSDDVAGNVPYGASKGALERLVVAAARELGYLGITANAVDPGPTETGWMSREEKRLAKLATPLGRIGLPADAAELVTFLCSPEAGWITGQRLRSDGGAWSGNARLSALRHHVVEHPAEER